MICIYIHYEIVATTKLINISITSHNFIFFLLFVVITHKIYPLSKFQVYNTVLLVLFTLLYIRSPELNNLV